MIELAEARHIIGLKTANKITKDNLKVPARFKRLLGNIRRYLFFC